MATTIRKKTTTPRARKAQQMLEEQLEVPAFANNQYKTYYVETLHKQYELERKAKRCSRLTKLNAIWMGFNVVTLIGLAFATWYACRTIESIL